MAETYLPTLPAMVDPSNQQLHATRWTDKQPFASVPYLDSLNSLIVGERKQIPPSEGVTPVQGMADPITHIATMIAPFAKAALSRQQPLIDPHTRILSSQRGSTSAGDGGESTMDAFKRMFLERGGVESGEGRAVASKVTPQQYAADMKNPPPIFTGHSKIPITRRRG